MTTSYQNQRLEPTHMFYGVGKFLKIRNVGIIEPKSMAVHEICGGAVAVKMNQKLECNPLI
ncbi:MAG: hypothetical protein EBT62_04615 [Opitutaceae bacterium]|jgi:hypothetical protein|nr:hypothetical protein [Opitutaceae bacterium]